MDLVTALVGGGCGFVAGVMVKTRAGTERVSYGVLPVKGERTGLVILLLIFSARCVFTVDSMLIADMYWHFVAMFFFVFMLSGCWLVPVCVYDSSSLPMH